MRHTNAQSLHPAVAPRFTLETAAVLSLLVQRQGPTHADKRSDQGPANIPTEAQLRNLEDFAKRLFGIRIDLRRTHGLENRPPFQATP